MPSVWVPSLASHPLTPRAGYPPQTLAETRIGELFDIVVDFPDSAAAIDDLRACLQRTQQHGDAVSGLGEALEARLLKPGADTSNVIQVGVNDGGV
jgi:anaphase-promoting complex subunit 2